MAARLSIREGPSGVFNIRTWRGILFGPQGTYEDALRHFPGPLISTRALIAFMQMPLEDRLN